MNADIVQKLSLLTFDDLETTLNRYVWKVVVKSMLSCGGVAPLSGEELSSGKKYNICLNDDIVDTPEQLEVFAHESIHIWLFEECGVEHRYEYEDEITASAGKFARENNPRLHNLLSQYLVR